MSCERLLRQTIRSLAIALFVVSVSACALQGMWGRLAQKPPAPGEWVASAESLGEFVFEVAPDSTAVTLVSVHFKQFQCGSTTASERWLHGDWWPDTSNTGAIIGGRFTVNPPMSGRYTLTFGGSPPDFSLFDEMTIRGRFDETGTRASGDWRVTWAGRVCSGNWESPKSVASPAAPVRLTTPVAPVRLGSGFTDSFDDNSHEWFVGDYRDQFVVGNRAIVGGKYRWAVQAYQPSRFSAVPQVDPVSDFYLIVDAKRVRGDLSCLYGLLFRRLDRNNFYLFQISDEQYFTFELLSQDEWTTLIDRTSTPAVRPGEVNQLAVRGQGSHFEFFINGEFVGEADNDEFSSGTVGIVIGFPDAGSRAVFEFDNFELGTLPTP